MGYEETAQECGFTVMKAGSVAVSRSKIWITYTHLSIKRQTEEDADLLPKPHKKEPLEYFMTQSICMASLATATN